MMKYQSQSPLSSKCKVFEDYHKTEIKSTQPNSLPNEEEYLLVHADKIVQKTTFNFLPYSIWKNQKLKWRCKIKFKQKVDPFNKPDIKEATSMEGINKMLFTLIQITKW